MLVAEYVRGRGIEVSVAEPEPPAADEVQIAVAFTGICGTDLHIAHGAMDERTGERRVIGHEMSGTVVASGANAQRWKPGTPVTVMPLRWCGTCPTCVSGNRHICERLVFVGIDAPGSLQELWNVPQDIVVELPRDMALRDAALVEPVAVAHHDVERGKVARDDFVVVVGGGPVGLLIAIVAQSRGAKVVVVEPDAFRRSVIEGVGIPTLDLGGKDVADVVAGLNGGAGAEVTFEVSGTQPGLDTAVAALRPRGRLVAVGIHPQPREIDVKRIFWKELEIFGARVYERSDYDAAIHLIASGAVPADAIISRLVPVADTPEAFGALAAGGAVMKVLIDMTGGEVP
jgi:(R,R)-butanediol dehydrogenase/meso-butanediol dehydrogenase/diacetyl reductase